MQTPGPIDNTDLVDPHTYQLLPNLEENRDFKVLAEDVWFLFSSWHGGGPPLPRLVVKGRTKP